MAGEWRSMSDWLRDKVHSCHRAFPVRTWFDKDDKKHTKKHMAAVMAESEAIERDGIKSARKSSMPPWDMLNGVLRKRPLETAGGWPRRSPRWPTTLRTATSGRE